MQTHDRTEIEAVRGDRSKLVAILEGAGAKFKSHKNECNCPFHDDKNPSSGVFQTKEGAWKFKCHTCGKGGDYFEILSIINGKGNNDVVAEFAKSKAPSKAGESAPKERTFKTAMDCANDFDRVGKREATYKYRNATDTDTLMGVLRLMPSTGKKTFRQMSPRGEGKDRHWVQSRPEGKCPIYNLPLIAAAPLVIVVEGEKCADALFARGFVATTSPMGAGKAAEADWKPLSGKKVVLWPDNDAVGKAHMEDVTLILEALTPPAVISMMDLSNHEIPEKGDAVDLIAAWDTRYKNENNLTANLLNDAFEEAIPYDGSRYVYDHVQDSISGKIKNVPFPFPLLTEFSQALLPKTVTILCGDPSVSKTFFVIQLLTDWIQQGVAASAMFFEDDKQFYMVRATAQYAGKGDFTKPKFIESNRDEAIRIRDTTRPFQAKFSRCVFVDSDEDNLPDYAKVEKWVESRAIAGDRIIVLDPVTAIGVGKDRAGADLNFLMKVKGLARKYGFSLFLVTHPKQDRNIGPSTAAMAGGTAFERFTHTIFWLSFIDQEEPTRIKAASGEVERNINRVMHQLKTRNGTGKGMSLGFHFEPDTLRFVEQGIIAKPPKKKGYQK